MLLILAFLLPLLIFLGLYYHKYHLRPKRLIKWYRDTLQGLGYNVLVFPYDPHKIMLLENQRHNARQYGDAMYDQKHNYKGVDVLISNTSHMVTLVLLQPRLIKHMFTPEKNYIIQKSHLNKYGFKLAMGTTMIMNQGEVWKNKRKVFSEVFNFQFVKRNLEKIKGISIEMLKEMEARSVSKEGKEEVQYTTDLKRVFGDIISNIIIRGFFGGEGSTATIDGLTINQYLGELLKDARTQSTDKMVLLFGQKAYDWGLGKKYRELTTKIARLKSQVKAIIDRRRKLLEEAGNLNIDRYTDIFQAMWIMKAKGDKTLSSLDENEMIEQFCAFMAAGNDSSSLFTTMLFYYLNENPEVQAKLRQEIDAKIPSEKEISFNNLKELRYLEWVQMEVTRMYGPATSVFLREVVQDTNIDNIPIMKGTGLKIELLPSHYNEKYFKNPNKFDPERWNTSEQVEPYAYGGFSFGPRSCIGKHLALFATKIIVVTMLKRYKKMEIVKDSQIRFEFKGFYMPTSFQTTLTKSNALSVPVQ